MLGSSNTDKTVKACVNEEIDTAKVAVNALEKGFQEEKFLRITKSHKKGAKKNLHGWAQDFPNYSH